LEQIQQAIFTVVRELYLPLHVPKETQETLRLPTSGVTSPKIGGRQKVWF